MTLVCSLAVAGIPERDKNGLPHLRSESVVIRNVDTGELLIQKNAQVIRPIASVTKLLSALVLSRLDAEKAPTATHVTILDEDKDRLKWSKSRMRVGLSFRASELVDAALVASDNRAMYAAVRARGLPREAFVEKMNKLAAELGMAHSTFQDPAGIDPRNQSTAMDLLLLLDAAAKDERVAGPTRLPRLELIDTSSRTLSLGSPNTLARSPNWKLVVAKTGYTVEAGRAFVVRTHIGDHLIDMVFLGAHEMKSVFGDAARVRRWLEARWTKAESVIAP